jgi:predicted ferric reductase
MTEFSAKRQFGTSGGRDSLRISPTALAIIYLLFCLAPLALAWTRPVAPASAWEYAAAALGLIGLGAMVVQFVTSGRFRIVSSHIGIDAIMAFHKIAAWWVLAALMLHPLAYVVPTWLDNPELGTERLVAYLTLPRFRSGVIAFAALALLMASSMLRDRLPWRYELWRASHVVLALTAVGGGVHHAVTVGRFSAMGAVHGFWWGAGAAVVVVIAILYGWRWIRLRRQLWRLASVTKRADRLWELDIQPAPGTLPIRYRAGQFVWMTEGKRRFPLFDHPFSIADSPLRPGLSLIVKEAGDFTRRIGALAPGTPIGIDGPYGDFTLEDRDGESILLVAGGVGIAPIMGLLRDLVARRDPRAIRLAYAVGQPENLACLPEIEAAQSSVDLQVMLVSETDGPQWTGLIGRLDRSRLKRMLEGLDPSRCVAFICGPGSMVTTVSDTLLTLGLPIDSVIFERFDYAADARSRQDRRRMQCFAAICAGLAAGVAIFTLAAR